MRASILSITVLAFSLLVLATDSIDRKNLPKDFTDNIEFYSKIDMIENLSFFEDDEIQKISNDRTEMRTTAAETKNSVEKTHEKD